MTFKKEQISDLRLRSQHIESTAFKKPVEVVRWMGALQAQDYEMSKWAVGARMAKATDATVEKAMDAGEIIRTHVLRPTWHLVAAEDLPWMLELTAPHVQRIAASSNKQLGLDDSILQKSNKIIEKALVQHQHLTREELLLLLKEANINTSENRAAHLLFAAELEGIICSGPRKGKQATYALIEDRIKKPIKLSREEALATLAMRYFTSHGPATLKDFAWWSGLGLTDAKKGIQLNEKALSSQTFEDQTYWFDAQVISSKSTAKGIQVLPAYDEFVISYTDRSASLALEHSKKTISNNGIFKPIIVADGQVIALWRRLSKPKSVHISFDFFEKPSAAVVAKIKEKCEAYAKFVGKEVVFEG